MQAPSPVTVVPVLIDPEDQSDEDNDNADDDLEYKYTYYAQDMLGSFEIGSAAPMARIPPYTIHVGVPLKLMDDNSPPTRELGMKILIGKDADSKKPSQKPRISKKSSKRQGYSSH